MRHGAFQFGWGTGAEGQGDEFIAGHHDFVGRPSVNLRALNHACVVFHCARG